MKTVINVGIIGLGGIGKMHFGVYKKNSKSKVVAVSDINVKRLKGVQSPAGINIDNPAAGNVDLKNIAAYEKAEDLINDPQVELVAITLPTFLHARYAIKALQAGKDVMCEKPMALNLKETDRMLEVVKKTGQKLMIGHCIRFWPEYEMLRKIVKSGRFGKLYSATFGRIGSTPAWGWQNWFRTGKLSGGAALDLHIHDTDFINWCFGLPKEVSSAGMSKTTGAIDHIVTNYKYGKNVQITAEGGWAFHPTFKFRMSFRAIFEKATVEFNSSKKPTLVIHTARGKRTEPKIASGDGFEREIDYFLGCIRKNKKPETVTPEDARDAVKVVMAEIESVRKGKPVLIQD